MLCTTYGPALPSPIPTPSCLLITAILIIVTALLVSFIIKIPVILGRMGGGGAAVLQAALLRLLLLIHIRLQPLVQHHGAGAAPAAERLYPFSPRTSGPPPDPVWRYNILLFRVWPIRHRQNTAPKSLLRFTP